MVKVNERAGLGARLLLVLMCFTAGEREARAGVMLESKESVVVGEELRVVVQTSKTHTPFMSHSSVSSDVKGWVVMVDLAKAGPLAGRSRVVGPVWDVPNARSSISLDAGANYSKEDVEAQRATPRVTFDEEGRVMRLRLTADGKGVEKSLLEVGPGTGGKVEAKWKGAEYVSIPHRVDWPSEDYVKTRSGKYHLQFAQGRAGLYEENTGKQVPDRWLENVFEQVCMEKDKGNMRMILTEDLKYLVLNPAPWNKNGTFVKTFKIGDKEYNREEYWVYWVRPNSEPILVKKAAGREWREMKMTPGYVDALSIGGQLWLVEVGEKFKRLVPMGGGEVSEVAVPGDGDWKYGQPRITQFLEKEGKLVMVWNTIPKKKELSFATIGIAVWDFRKKKLTLSEVVVDELFEEKGGAYVPLKVVGVESAEKGAGK